MVAEIFNIRSLGAFYFFNEFKWIAFMLLLNIRTVLSVVCAFLFFGLGSQSSWRICQKVGPSLPCCIWKACRGFLAGMFTSAEPPSHVSPRSAVCFLCPCHLAAAVFHSFSAFVACGPEVNWITSCSFQWYEVILGKQYFWQNMFHLVLNDFSKMNVIQASHLGMRTYQATFHFER